MSLISRHHDLRDADKAAVTALATRAQQADRTPPLTEAAQSGVRDTHALSQVVRRTIGRWVNQRLRRRPMIVPLVIEA